MAVTDIRDYLDLIPAVSKAPQQAMWVAFDPEADTLTINFTKPSHADDSELTDDDVIIRYQGDEIVGMTILHASKRHRQAA